MKKKLAIVGTVGIPAKYGGFETLTEYITKDLSEKYDITVFCSSKSYEKVCHFIIIITRIRHQCQNITIFDICNDHRT